MMPDRQDNHEEIWPAQRGVTDHQALREVGPEARFEEVWIQTDLPSIRSFVGLRRRTRPRSLVDNTCRQ